MSDQKPALDHILSTAIDLPLSERHAFIEQACAGDQEKFQEACSLLEAYEKSAGFMEEPAAINVVQMTTDDDWVGPKKLEPGTILRQYRILSQIGAGGMGEVYRARDTNLERDVAVKVLTPSLADNPVNLARLEREAQAIAVLSHPNVLAVYDFGVEDGVAFLVTELLTGETLRERISQGALPLRKVEEIGCQVARGLAAAHDKSIVHRDLKPENIFLDVQGRVKILDFGLATEGGALSIAGGTMDRSVDTVTNLTVAGTVLGTVNYMSPEQVQSAAVDNRSDIFSFGSVLYEMVTGERPFQRETNAEVMTAILKEEPKGLALLANEIPPALVAIIRRCLEKQVGERFHSAHDLAFSLQSLSGSSISTLNQETLAELGAARKLPKFKSIVVLLLMGLLMGTAATLWWSTKPSQGTPTVFVPLSSRYGMVTNARFLDDGNTAIYSANWDGEPVRVFPSTAGTRAANPLPIESADLLSVSVTGELALSLNRRYPGGFEAIGTLAIARADGAVPRRILDDVFVADWSPDGESLAVAHEVDGVVRLEYPIGNVLYESAGWISHLRIHPDGQQIVFVNCPARGDNMSFVKTVDSQGVVSDLHPGGAWGVLWDADGETIWSASGHGLFQCKLGEQPTQVPGMLGALNLFDRNNDGDMLVSVGSVRREMMVLAPGAVSEENLGWLDWSTPQVMSDDGRWIFFEEGNEWTDDGYSFYMRETSGEPPLMIGYGSMLALSPDAKSIAVGKNMFGDEPNVVIMPTGTGRPYDIDLNGLVFLSYLGDWVEGTAPSDESGLLLNCRDDEGIAQLYFVSLNSSDLPRAVTPPDLPLRPIGQAIAPDGSSVVVKPAGGPAVRFGVDGSGPYPLQGLLSDDVPLEFSSDGQFLFVRGAGSTMATIYRVDLRTGERELWLELSPSESGGVFSVEFVKISQSGEAYAYSFRRTINRLGVISEITP